MMEHIAFFPNTSSAGNSAPSDMLANLAALGAEAADGISFDALMSAQISTEAGAASSSAATQAAPQAGSFEDVSVILQLLRVAQSEAAPQGPDAATLTSSPNGALDNPEGEAALPSAPISPATPQADIAPNPAPHPLLMAQMQMPRAAKADALMASSEVKEIAEQKPEAAVLAPDTNLETSAPVTESESAAPLLALPTMPATAAATPAVSALAFAAAQLQADHTPASSRESNEAELAASLGSRAAPEHHPKPAATLTPLPKMVAPDMAASTDLITDIPSRTAAMPREFIAPAALPTAPVTATNSPAPDNMASLSGLLSVNAPIAAESVQQGKQSVVDFGERLLEIGNDDAWIDQLAKDIAATKSSAGNISFRLMPANLGRIDVAMLQNDQGVSVHVDAQNETAASLVAASQVRLVEELRQQGVRVNHTEVTHTANEAGRQAGQEQGRGQNPAAAPFIETAPEFFSDGPKDKKGDALPKGRYA